MKNGYNSRKNYPDLSQDTSLIISQFGGPDGELAASMRYLSQRYTMPCKEVGGLLTDIGTEELAHLEMICAIIYQLTKNLTPEQAKTAALTPIISTTPRRCAYGCCRRSL